MTNFINAKILSQSELEKVSDLINIGHFDWKKDKQIAFHLGESFQNGYLNLAEEEKLDWICFLINPITRNKAFELFRYFNPKNQVAFLKDLKELITLDNANPLYISINQRLFSLLKRNMSIQALQAIYNDISSRILNFSQMEFYMCEEEKKYKYLESALNRNDSDHEYLNDPRVTILWLRDHYETSSIGFVSQPNFFDKQQVVQNISQFNRFVNSHFMSDAFQMLEKDTNNFDQFYFLFTSEIDFLLIEFIKKYGLQKLKPLLLKFFKYVSEILKPKFHRQKFDATESYQVKQYKRELRLERILELAERQTKINEKRIAILNEAYLKISHQNEEHFKEDYYSHELEDDFLSNRPLIDAFPRHFFDFLKQLKREGYYEDYIEQSLKEILYTLNNLERRSIEIENIHEPFFRLANMIIDLIRLPLFEPEPLKVPFNIHFSERAKEDLAILKGQNFPSKPVYLLKDKLENFKEEELEALLENRMFYPYPNFIEEIKVKIIEAENLPQNLSHRVIITLTKIYYEHLKD